MQDKAHVGKFFEASGPPSMFYVYEAAGAAKPTLHRLGPTESITGKLVYFVRLNPKGIYEKSVESDVGWIMETISSSMAAWDLHAV